MLRVTRIRLPLDHDEARLREAVAERLGLSPDRLLSLSLQRRSVDARQRAVMLEYTVDVTADKEDSLLAADATGTVRAAPSTDYLQVPAGSARLSAPPLVVGSGPAGLFAALLLAERGYRPLILEQGKAVEERTGDVSRFMEGGPLLEDSNIQFGEGGAGTFSDGKLYTLINDGRCRKIYEDLVAAGAPEEILVSNRPHVGTDVLRRVVRSLRERLLAAGGQVRFGSRVTDLTVNRGRISGVRLADGTDVNSPTVILAVGHSARRTFEMLHHRGVILVPKPFALGVRIEHPQSLVDRARYGPWAGHPRLGPADYKLVHHCRGGRSVFTFCMCPGGVVVPAASEADGVVTNGMSTSDRGGANANSALLVNVTPEDFGGSGPLAGVDFQRTWERKAYAAGGGGHRAPVQRAADFLLGCPSTGPGSVTPSYRPGWAGADLAECLPGFAVEALREALPALERRLRGFALPDAVLTGVETRSSSPVRIPRDEKRESSLPGVYPVGEGAGHAGGIVSAAVDGLKTAEEIIRRFAPPS